MASRAATLSTLSKVTHTCRRSWSLICGTSAAPQIRTNDRARLRGSTGRPVRVVTTRPVSVQSPPAALALGLLPFPLCFEDVGARWAAAGLGVRC